MSLRRAISSYTGIASDDIVHDFNIGHLGVDSLAAVELVEELQTLFGKKFAEDDSLTISFKSLAELLVQFLLDKKVKFSKPRSSATTSLIRDSSFSPSGVQSLQMALKLLFDTSCAPVDSIEEKLTLSELGIDSLSVVELKGDFLGARDAYDKRSFSAFEGHIKSVMNCNLLLSREIGLSWEVQWNR